MIKYRSKTQDGTLIIGFVLTKENIVRLKKNDPVCVKFKDLDIAIPNQPEAAAIIAYTQHRDSVDIINAIRKSLDIVLFIPLDDDGIEACVDVIRGTTCQLLDREVCIQLSIVENDVMAEQLLKPGITPKTKLRREGIDPSINFDNN